MKRIIIGIINLYQSIPLRSHYSCQFIPTCSNYTKEAIVKYGVLKGVCLGVARILKCHPWQKNHYDPLK